MEYTVGPGEAQARLDVYLADKMAAQHSRAQVQKRIRNGAVLVNDAAVTPHYPVKEGDKVRVEQLDAPADGLPAEAIPLKIVYEDDDCLVVDKEAGMVVHPAHGNPCHTLVNALLFHVRSLGNASDKIRPGIVHRLDKDTSGLLVVAKNDFTHAKLARQFKDHTIERVYRAVVRGVVQHDEGICEEPVGRAFLNRKKVVVRPSGGKDAVTCFRVIQRYARATVVEVRPKTGRTHQIRVHFAHMGHPILGDTFYGVPCPLIRRQALHAAVLGFEQPRTRKWISLTSELPEDMRELLASLGTLP